MSGKDYACTCSKVMGLDDNVPLVSALTNDNGFQHIFSEQPFARAIR